MEVNLSLKGTEFELAERLMAEAYRVLVEAKVNDPEDEFMYIAKQTLEDASPKVPLSRRIKSLFQ